MSGCSVRRFPRSIVTPADVPFRNVGFFALDRFLGRVVASPSRASSRTLRGRVREASPDY